PTVAWREDRLRFWAAIARGLRSEEAAVEAGVSPAVGTRWFRHAGGVGPNLSPTASGRYTNENTNGLLRQYFPKGTDLSRWEPDEIEAVALALNNRPRKTLGWKTPTEALNEHLLLFQQAGVATTG
ncbi:transposase, partial [Actinacidiphila soli]|uniref:transposase n=1 Tax=Actinacidiphila soli TaxID=2487275 RepID=UPI0038996B9A